MSDQAAARGRSFGWRPLHWLRAWITARLDGCDETARASGWTIEVLPRGRRRYRDTRFDQLTADCRRDAWRRR